MPESCRSAASPSCVVGVNRQVHGFVAKRQTAVECPPSSRFELAAIASKTGCTSPGEEAMTLRISAVAVWRSSASLVSLSRRTFSIAITAWSAKVRISSIWRAGVWPASGQPTRIAPTATPSLSIGAPIDAPPRAGGGEGVVVGRIGQRVVERLHRRRQDRPAGQLGAVGGRGIERLRHRQGFAGQLRVATRLTTRPS